MFFKWFVIFVGLLETYVLVGLLFGNLCACLVVVILDLLCVYATWFDIFGTCVCLKGCLCDICMFDN